MAREMGLILFPVFLPVALCAGMSPEKMLPFAAQVVSKRVYSNENWQLCFLFPPNLPIVLQQKHIHDLVMYEFYCRQLQAVELWELELVSHIAQTHAWPHFFDRKSRSVTVLLVYK